MILRLSQKLSTKYKIKPPTALPPDPNPFADWSANLFTAGRTQFIIVTNTPSLYSTVFCAGRNLDGSQLVEGALAAILDFMAADGLEFIYRRFVAPACGTVQFSKALSRSVTGSTNDLMVHADRWLTEGELSPHDTSLRLNDIPFLSLNSRTPREVFKALAVVD